MSGTLDTSFLAELKRRKVGRVAIAYGGVMAGVLEVSQYGLELFSISGPFYRALLFAAVGGLPIVLVLAWLFDVTSKGIERTPSAPDVAGTEGFSTRFTRQLVVTGAIVILAMTGIGWRYMPSDSVQLVSNQVTVLPFENLTGDPTLGDHGIIVANHIVEGLGQLPEFKTVSFNPRVEDQARRVTPEGTLEEAVGNYTGSALVINGSYSRTGDDLIVRATVHDAERGEVTFSAPEVRVGLEEPMAGFEQMKEGLLGYFGVLGSRTTESAGASRRLASRTAPSFAAYKEFALGLRAGSDRDWRGSAEHFERAASIDPTFFAALWRASAARMNQRDWAGVERLVERMESMQPELTENELVGLKWSRSQVRGDLRGSYEAAVRSTELIPTSPVLYLAGIATNALHRPEEAIGYFSQYDLKWGGHWPWIWTEFASSRHSLGQHRRELWLIRKSREALQEHPDLLVAEFSALAALVRGAEIEERIGELGQVIHVLRVAEEVEAHGDPETARRLFERVLDRLDEFTPEEQLMFAGPLLRVEALAALGRDDEARTLLGTFLEATPQHAELRSLSAILAARAGEREAAEETIDWLGALEIPYQRGANVRQQARIAAALGDAERAVRFLETAFEQGSQSFMGLHVDPAYRDVRDHPAFVAFMAPRG